jgi:TonB family protein
LLSQTFEVPTHNLVNHFFNHSLLKQRIIMLQKNKSQRIKLLKYGLSAPLFMLMLILSSATVNGSKAVKIIKLRTEQVLAAPAITESAINKPADSLNRNPTYAVPSAIVKTNNQDIKKDSTVSATDTLNKDNSQVFAAVEQAPSFPGGTDAFYKFLASNTIYPEAMRANNIQGKVIVTFVVEKDGSLSNVRALKGPGYGANEEAVRVVSLSPKWTPGYQNGKPVRVQFTTSLMFSLADATTRTVANADTGKKPIDVVLIPPGKADPLYIIDGKEVKTNGFKTVNPSDINSIYVLKDKAAVTQYGSKGKNGVILVFTKAYTGPLPTATTNGK